VSQPGVEPDGVKTFDEAVALRGALGHLRGSQLMDLLLK
jgi:2,3-bisphosphoglycerate-independent phosphoglycerate mutase